MKSIRCRLSATCFALVMAALVMPAQAGGQVSPFAAVAPVSQVISINPLSVAFGGISGEYERRLGVASTVGIGGTLYAPAGFTYTTLEGKARFYPSGKALEGFSVGSALGLTSVSANEETCDDWTGTCSTSKATANAVTAGIEVDYQWLLGPKRNFAVTLGVGSKRLMFLGQGLSGASVAIPTARFSIGFGL